MWQAQGFGELGNDSCLQRVIASDLAPHVTSVKGIWRLRMECLSVLRACIWRATLFSRSGFFQGVETAGLKFRLVDAKEQVVGRLAAQLSVILQVSLSSSCCFDALYTI